MIKTLIFDFGDVFINLDKTGAMENALSLFGLNTFENDMLETNISYEIGRISTEDFIQFYQNKFPNLMPSTIVDTWNSIIKDFPKYRLEFIKHIKETTNYKLILLSNTNEIHIDYIKSNINFYNDFKDCFDHYYLSHQIHLRKPDAKIFEFVLKENKLNATECLFIDDTKENTDMAKSMHLKVWNIDETKEDVVHLFSVKKHLF